MCAEDLPLLRSHLKPPFICAGSCPQSASGATSPHPLLPSSRMQLCYISPSLLPLLLLHSWPVTFMGSPQMPPLQNAASPSRKDPQRGMYKLMYNHLAAASEQSVHWGEDSSCTAVRGQTLKVGLVWLRSGCTSDSSFIWGVKHQYSTHRAAVSMGGETSAFPHISSLPPFLPFTVVRLSGRFLSPLCHSFSWVTSLLVSQPCFLTAFPNTLSCDLQS